ncbi:MAG: hypothetical protein H5T94_03880 [Pseudothermotoga sp.]|nr:hypothetical protein [Pseudothermotoga sp.]
MDHSTSTKQTWKLAHVITGELLQQGEPLLVANNKETCCVWFDKQRQKLRLATNDLITLDDLKR